jgi:peptidoglycan/xylan/chitin deacetylase (PgdA/CDA1 family)
VRLTAAFLGRVASATGLPVLARRVLAARGTFVLELHGVPARDYPGMGHDLRPTITAVGLRRVLAWVSERFELLSVDQLLGGGRSGVLLTFDDGLANNHNVVLPILVEFRAPAVFFVTTGPVQAGGVWLHWYGERLRRAGLQPSELPDGFAADVLAAMNPTHVARCAAHPLVAVGSHTERHPRLTTLPDADLQRELSASRAYLEGLTGRVVDVLAYPYGDADERVAGAARAAGYRAAFVEGPRPISDPLFNILRVGVYCADEWYLDLKLCGLHRRPIDAPLIRSGAPVPGGDPSGGSH